MIVRSLRLFPEKLLVRARNGETGKRGFWRITFDRVGLDELCTIHEQRLGDVFPRGYRLWQAEVHMCGGKLVDVKPDVLWPRVFDQIFVWEDDSKPRMSR
jgi:hypothetical protein